MVWMIDVNKIYSGHALEILKTFDDESINMCITSPPYWGLRDYKTNPVKWSDGWEGELGAEPDFNQYINHLCDIFDEYLYEQNTKHVDMKIRYVHGMHI